MSYTPAKQKRLFFDLESKALEEALALMDAPKVTAPANYKDPAKIAEYIEAETEKRRLEMIERAALDPDLGKITSIGLATSIDGPIVSLLVGDTIKQLQEDENGKLILGEDGKPIETEYTLTEADLILTFWQNFAECGGRAVGYNILGFDLPYLQRRSMYLGVRVPYLPVLAKYRTDPITDLMGILYNWGPAKGLKQVCKLLHIPNDCPGVDGSQVATLDRETLRAYQASDVKLTIELFKRMNGVYFSL